MKRWPFNGNIQIFMTGLILLMTLFLFSGLGTVNNFQRGKTYAPAQSVSVNRMIRVEVSGAVANPGLYELEEDARVFQALAAAGGLQPGADTRGINLAAHLYNGQRLEIPYPNNTHPPVATATASPAMEAGAVVAAPALTSTPGSDSCSEPVVGSGVFIWPAQARFLSGYDFSPAHPGIDIAAGIGSPVYAADGGVIRQEGNDNTGYGNVIEIDHGNGFSTVYAHLSVIEVQACKRVYAGQRIGLAGKTGNADGAHLHFEVVQDGEYIDPWSIFPGP